MGLFLHKCPSPLGRDSPVAVADDTYVPQCHKVRLGTIKPCELWLMRSGVQWGGGAFRQATKAS
ncbi:hypothetical protein GCM10009715_36010 [Paeniglutamicibacter psychrophenolicus]